jgi:hypothetical protein
MMQINSPGLENQFGNIVGPAAAGPWRYNFGHTTLFSAQSFAMLPDSWVLQHTGDPLNAQAVPAAAAGTTQLDVVGLAASGLTTAPTLTVKAIFVSADQKVSQARTVTQITGDTILWSEDLNGDNTLDPGEDFNLNGGLDHHPLPAWFTPASVRLEIQERRYTWLLTVRRDASGVAEVDVVIFFRRRFDAQDEALYDLAGQGFQVGYDEVQVTYTVGLPPSWKAGGFVFDANNARWYRLRKVTDNGGGTATLKLATPAAARTPTGAGIVGRVMIPQAVVDVYPIGQKVFP